MPPICKGLVWNAPSLKPRPAARLHAAQSADIQGISDHGVHRRLAIQKLRKQFVTAKRTPGKLGPQKPRCRQRKQQGPLDQSCARNAKGAATDHWNRQFFCFLYLRHPADFSLQTNEADAFLPKAVTIPCVANLKDDNRHDGRHHDRSRQHGH